MDGDDAAGIVGGGHRGLQLGFGKSRARHVAGGPAVVGIQLDQVGAAGDLGTDGPDDVVDATGLLGALRHGDAGFVALRTIGAQCHDGARGDHHARPGDDALVDRLLQADIGIAGALGAKVAFGGKAGHQGRLGLGDRASGAQGQRFVQDLVVPAGFVIGMQEEVAVALDQAGQHGLARQVDDFGPGGRAEIRADRGDLAVLDQDLPAGMGLAIDAVEDLLWFKQQRLGRRLCRARAQQGRGHTGKKRRLQPHDPPRCPRWFQICPFSWACP